MTWKLLCARCMSMFSQWLVTWLQDTGGWSPAQANFFMCSLSDVRLLCALGLPCRVRTPSCSLSGHGAEFTRNDQVPCACPQNTGVPAKCITHPAERTSSAEPARKASVLHDRSIGEPLRGLSLQQWEGIVQEEQLTSSTSLQ